MITTKVKVDGKTIRLGGAPSFDRGRMLNLGRFAVTTVKARVARGVGSDDTQMPALNRGYAAYKRRLGASEIRDMNLTGRMLDAFRVRYADAGQVRMDITTQHGRDAARGTDRKTPWYGFSNADQTAIIAEARKQFKDIIADYGTRLRGARSRATASSGSGLLTR